MDTQPPADALTPADEAALAEDTAAIQRSYNNIRAEAVVVGERLAKWNETLSRGKWLCWVETELPFSAQTARNLIHLAALAKTKPVLDLPIDLSGLYVLAAPSTPEAAVDEVIGTAKTGKVTKKAVKDVVTKHKTAPASKGKSRRKPSASSAGTKPKPLTTPEFRQQLEAVIKRLQARAANPGEDFIEGVRNCVAELAALLARWVST
jgi:hypothetical protein